MKYRVLRVGVSQRDVPGGPIVPRDIGDVIEVSDAMAAFFMAANPPLVEPADSEKRRRKKSEED